MVAFLPPCEQRRCMYRDSFALGFLIRITSAKPLLRATLLHAVRFFRVKISENHTSRIFLSRGGGVTEELTMELEVVCF